MPASPRSRQVIWLKQIADERPTGPREHETSFNPPDEVAAMKLMRILQALDDANRRARQEALLRLQAQQQQRQQPHAKR
jgi:hypothetical protein